MSLARLDDENLTTATTEDRSYIYFAIILHITHNVTINEKWLFVGQLFLK